MTWLRSLLWSEVGLEASHPESHSPFQVLAMFRSVQLVAFSTRFGLRILSVKAMLNQQFNVAVVAKITTVVSALAYPCLSYDNAQSIFVHYLKISDYPYQSISVIYLNSVCPQVHGSYPNSMVVSQREAANQSATTRRRRLSDAKPRPCLS